MQCSPEQSRTHSRWQRPSQHKHGQADQGAGPAPQEGGQLLPGPARLHPGRTGQAALLTHNLCNGTLFSVNVCYAKVEPRQALLQGGTGSTPDSRPRQHGPAPCRAAAARPSAAPPFCTAGSETAADLNLSLRWAPGRRSKPCKRLAGAERHTAPAIPGHTGDSVTGGSPEPGFSPSPPLRAALCKCRHPGAPLPPPVPADSGSPGHGIL